MNPLRAAALSALALAALAAPAPAQFAPQQRSTTPSYYEIPQYQYQPGPFPPQGYQVPMPNYPHLSSPNSVEKAGEWWLTAVIAFCVVIMLAILARVVVVSRAKTNPYLLPADDWWLTQGQGTPPDQKGAARS